MVLKTKRAETQSVLSQNICSRLYLTLPNSKDNQNVHLERPKKSTVWQESRAICNTQLLSRHNLNSPTLDALKREHNMANSPEHKQQRRPNLSDEQILEKLGKALREYAEEHKHLMGTETHIDGVKIPPPPDFIKMERERHQNALNSLGLPPPTKKGTST